MPLGIAELVSELLYAGKTLAEIADYDGVQMMLIVCRKRDKYGKLIRGEQLPPGVEVDSEGMRVVSNPVSFEGMFRGLKLKQTRGNRELTEQLWEGYLEANPSLRKFLGR